MPNFDLGLRLGCLKIEYNIYTKGKNEMLKTVAKIELFVNKPPKITNRSVNPDHVWFIDEVDIEKMKLNNWIFGDYDALYRVKLPDTEFFTDKDGFLKLSN